MKLSIELKPAPTWKVPVGFSATSKLMLTLSGEEPCSVETSTRSKYPSAVMRRLLASMALSENRSPSWRMTSRRMTLSRVLVLPLTSMRSM